MAQCHTGRAFSTKSSCVQIVTPELWSISVTWQGLQYDGGSPVLDYKLTLLDSNNIVQQNQSQIRGTNHTFFNLQQNRQYNIVLEARNAIGYSKPSNNIVRTRKADPPRVLSITNAPSLQTVNITWTSTNDNTGVPILEYQTILVDTVTKLQRNFDGIKDSSLYVTGLHHNRTYQVYVKARNENEYGRFEGNNFTTLEADPPGPPIIKAQPLILAIKLAWNSSLMDIHNIPILDYRITITDSEGYLQEYILAAARSSLVIQNLQRNKTFIVKIQARNEMGYGETANITASTSPAGPPDAPKISNVKVEGKTCTLQWTKPSDGQSPIETYTVSVWMVITNNGSEYKKRMGSWNTMRMKHDLVLKWNQSYTVAVSAWNSYGQSASSLHKQFKTDTKPEEVSTKTRATTRTEVVSTSEVPAVPSIDYYSVLAGYKCKPQTPMRDQFPNFQQVPC
ncbi:fibronectin type III domain-containing protein 3B-like [Acropora muricata]|uniref:fibronectin type III domain-containing protein 3B-like n=1 Tax=Acropora muricata TaxID=159855 RepID=UPI0034E4B75C